MLSDVCKDVSIEPSFQPLAGEHFRQKTAKANDDARVEVKERGIWRRGQTAFFDVRIKAY